MRNQPTTPLNRDIRLYLVVPFVIGFSWLGLFVVLFNLYLLRLGYGPRFIGLLTALGPLMFIVMSIPGGLLSRRWGSRRLIILGVSIYTVSFTLLPWGEYLDSPGREVWFATTLLTAYLGGAFYWPNADIYLMQVTTAANRGRAFALQQALYPLAGFLGSLLAGQLPSVFAWLLDSSIDQPTPYRYALQLCGFVYLVGVGAMLMTHDPPTQPLMRESEETRAGGRKVPKRWWALLRLMLPLAIFEMLWRGAAQGPTRFYNMFLDVDLQVAPEQIGLLMGIGQLVAAALALTAPWFSRRLGNGRVIVLLVSGLIAVLLLMANSTSWVSAGATYMIFQALIAISISVIAIYRMEQVDAMWWGWASGIAVTVRGIGESSAFLSGGMLIEQYGFASFFLATAGVLLLGLLCFLVYHCGRRPLDRQIDSSATS